LNKADKSTRDDGSDDERIDDSVWRMVWDRFGPLHMDLMASPANVIIRDPEEGRPIDFFSMNLNEGSSGQDLFAQKMYGLRNLYCFP